MNGYELADEIKNKLDDSESYYGDAESLLIKSESMLRQQQAEIEALKEEIIGYCADEYMKPVEMNEELVNKLIDERLHFWYLLKD